MTFHPLIGHTGFFRTLTVRFFIACLVLTGMIGFANHAGAQPGTAIPQLPTLADNQVGNGLKTPNIGLVQKVKVIVDSKTNRLTLVGSKEDIAVVIQAIHSIREQLNVTSDPIVTEKVLLHSQLADTVASIMQAAIPVHDPEGPRVNLNAVHFPEAILISGPASAVKRAKQLLATIDRTPLPTSKR